MTGECPSGKGAAAGVHLSGPVKLLFTVAAAPKAARGAVPTAADGLQQA
ncbi:MAG: hypothetical protein K0S14_1993 [Thermomicrobiales bacterium]|nr:hypothetical protein [Thermomicrobiales bacterium]